uniref:uncharacterized protein DDB_G0271670-like n=1 Tax=Solea senegalensis TaxID=28829 RepID=UPI001CD8E561|nr:uncharacterized protein DDB_G0271670-like [Solea senegalensis]
MLMSFTAFLKDNEISLVKTTILSVCLFIYKYTLAVLRKSRIMDYFVSCFFLLFQLLTISDAQIEATTTAPTGCAGPPALCCPDQNLTCFRGCFCDEICILLNDCCEDYRSTCVSLITATPTRASTSNGTTASAMATLTSTVSSTTAPTATSSSRAPALVNASSTSASGMSATPANTQISNATTPTPADNGSTLSVSVVTASGTTNSNTDGNTTAASTVSAASATSQTMSDTSLTTDNSTLSHSVPTAPSTQSSNATSPSAHLSTTSGSRVSTTTAQRTTSVVVSTKETSQTSSSTSSTPTYGLRTSVSTISTATVGTALSDTSSTSSVTSPPADGSTAEVSPTTTRSNKDYQTLTVYLKAFVSSYNDKNKNLISEALCNLISQALFLQNCTDCTVVIKHIKRH